MCALEAERYPLSACKGRWLELFALEHATLARVVDVAREGESLVVTREPAGASLADGAAVARAHRAALLFQAAAAAAFFHAHGVALAPDDLGRAALEIGPRGALLWLTRMPRAAAAADSAADPGARARAAETLAEFLTRLFARGRRVTHRAAAALLAQLRTPEARWKRPEFWLAGILRAFPELAGPQAEPTLARERTLGFSGEALRSPEARVMARKAEALAKGRTPRVFRADASRLTPGGAIGLPEVRDAAEASRLLRKRGALDGGGAVWIAVAPEDWDALSLRAFETAALSLPEGAEVVRIPKTLPPPSSPAAWRDALWAPCGTIAASVRFYERLAQESAAAPEAGRDLARRIVRRPGWARFSADPTGDGPWPEEPEDSPESVARMSAHEDRSVGSDPGHRIERLLAEGRVSAAVEEARLWVASAPEREVEAWFPLAARLCPLTEAESAPARFAWLEAIEAERELAGGRAGDARDRLERLVRSESSGLDQRRRAALRLAETAAARDAWSEAARRAAAWRRAHPDAPAGETVRALALGAVGLAREGRIDPALALLEDADALGLALSEKERVETALVRARVLALAGRVADEEALYDALRPAALAAGDQATARFLAQEARRLLDRREFARAILRLREALEAERDDPCERAALQLDLAAALFHSGDPVQSEARLTECLAAASAAGRDDLIRMARGNRTELLIDRGAWEDAAAEVASLESAATAGEDSLARLVALHHRGRLALRRGFLTAAAADNARARELAEKLSDRLEIGELWLEEGDRRLYEGDPALARAAFENAARLPPDRSGRDALARTRLAELDAAAGSALPDSALDELLALLATDPYRGAEAVVRWRFLLGIERLPEALLRPAERILRARGGEALADVAFPRAAPVLPREALRGLRDEIASVFRGDEPDGHRVLESLGIAGLALRDAEGRELARLGRPAGLGEESGVRTLEAGSARFELALWPAAAPEAVESIAWLLETLLFRSGASPSPADFAEGWRRLGIVTADRSMEDPYLRLTRFAAQTVTVLVLGPSGSGKEAVARAVHRLSPRASGPFVAVNVPAIPAALLESELFGHVRGAFTGAERDRRGLLEEAAGGSVFLDEVGDLASPLQAKLLRALQEREIRRVGENRPRPIDVRVVSATSRDLAERVEAGEFREDLFYRLHVAVLRLPALRERGRDALLLARHFLDAFAREYGRGRLTLTPEAAAAILAYPWPGNVRELQNAVSQAAALCDADGCVALTLLPERVRHGAERAPEAPAGDYRTRIDAHRRDVIADALGRAGGNRTRAARQLGLSRQALHYLIRELRIAPRA
ncbi:MAG TPA: sigma 54-interacting transcriptional regulator [Thermoanaerobaculia bacterium]